VKQRRGGNIMFIFCMGVYIFGIAVVIFIEGYYYSSNVYNRPDTDIIMGAVIWPLIFIIVVLILPFYGVWCLGRYLKKFKS